MKSDPNCTTCKGSGVVGSGGYFLRVPCMCQSRILQDRRKKARETIALIASDMQGPINSSHVRRQGRRLAKALEDMR